MNKIPDYLHDSNYFLPIKSTYGKDLETKILNEKDLNSRILNEKDLNSKICNPYNKLDLHKIKTVDFKCVHNKSYFNKRGR